MVRYFRPCRIIPELLMQRRQLLTPSKKFVVLTVLWKTFHHPAERRCAGVNLYSEDRLDRKGLGGRC